MTCSLVNCETFSVYYMDTSMYCVYIEFFFYWQANKWWFKTDLFSEMQEVTQCLREVLSNQHMGKKEQ